MFSCICVLMQLGKQNVFLIFIHAGSILTYSSFLPLPSSPQNQVLDRTERLASSTFRLGTDTQKIFGQPMGGYPDRRGGGGGGRGGEDGERGDRDRGDRERGGGGRGGGRGEERQPSLRAQGLMDGQPSEREERRGGGGRGGRGGGGRGERRGGF